MSHELRTPLNAIIGFSELQQMKYADADEEFLTCSNEINVAGYHLLSLVNDILDTVQIEQNRMSVSLKSYQLSKIVESCIQLVQQQADQFDVSIVNEIPSALYIIADTIRLKQVWINLLTNAIKYNHKGGSVTLRARELDETLIEFSLTENGVGIAASEHAAIFEPFKRLEYAENAQIDGEYR
jgi:signal transduction histidine kinase